MLELKWDGKDEALKVAEETKTYLLEFEKNFSFGEKNSGNLIVQGDNLKVLKSLLPFYRGQVKCIYIDPFPHSDWLSLMYPRLELLRDFLSEDGAIFISIDDTEQAYLKVICDEIFGRNHFVISLPRVTKKGGKSAEIFARNNDSLLMYSKSESCKLNPFQHDDAGFKNRDEFFEQRGFYKLNQTLDYDSLQYSESLDYPLTIENVTYYAGSSEENYLERKAGNHKRADWAWRWSREKFKFGYENGFIVVKKSRNGTRIYTKTYQRATIDNDGRSYFIDYKKRTAPISSLILTENEFSNDNATKNITAIFGEKVFDYSKPVSLVEFVCKLATGKDSIILDAFAGSGTTAHAVLKFNEADGGNRKFILIEEKDYCKTITAERVRRVGGSFDFYRLGEEITDSEGKINSSVTFEQLANFVWFSETKTPYLEQKNSPLLGIYNGVAIYLLQGEDKILTKKILSEFPQHDGEKIIYGSACRIDENFLEENKIIFRQIPKELKL